MKYAEKPPLGIRPKRFSVKERKLEILDACIRYVNALKPIPKEWLDELGEDYEHHQD
jgi:hypothetical protein